MRVIGLMICVASAAGGSWPQYAHDPGRSGATTEEVRPPFERKWYRLFADAGLQSGVQPVIARGTLFIGTLRGTLHAIDAETGNDIWTYKTGGPILHAAAVYEGMVFVGSADGRMYALNATDGTLCWRTATGAAIWNAPAVSDNRVYFGGRDGFVYALDAVLGSVRWKADAGAPILNSPALDLARGKLYIGSEDMRVRAFNLTDGQEAWRSEVLPGVSFRGYHPVVAPDGAVMITTQPILGYDRFQELLLDMVKRVFGDFASWRHKKDENDRLRAENFRLMQNPETYPAQLRFLRQRLADNPFYQTFFALDPETGRQRFVAPVVASESMNGPGAPPIVAPDGKVIVKYQALLRSRYEHYSPFMNVGYLDTQTGNIVPIMDQDRIYGWHDSLLLVHDEQCQLSVGGAILFNTHQDNVNALDLQTRRGYPEPLALNLHEPARGEALALALRALHGEPLSPGNEWLIRGTAVYGGGSALDVPVVVAGDSFYYLPTHELNSGCALIAYRAKPGGAGPKRHPIPAAQVSDAEWQRIVDLPWDWDTLAHPRLTNLLAALPSPVPGTLASPLTSEAEKQVQKIPETTLDAFIWRVPTNVTAPLMTAKEPLRTKLHAATTALLEQQWMPLVLPAAKAPADAYRFFTDPSETVYTLLLARPFLDENLQARLDACIARLVTNGLPREWPVTGASRIPYLVPERGLRIVNDAGTDNLARLYVLWLWSTVSRLGASYLDDHWPELRNRIDLPGRAIAEDCGNSRLAGLIAYCRIAKALEDGEALTKALPVVRQAMRQRLAYELAHTRGGVLGRGPGNRAVFARWRNLTPEVAALLRAYALPINTRLMSLYVDYHRPGWWLAWNVEQLMRNEAPTQLPGTAWDIFNTRALLLQDTPEQLSLYVDIPWCKADEFYIRKLALALGASE